MCGKTPTPEEESAAVLTHGLPWAVRAKSIRPSAGRDLGDCEVSARRTIKIHRRSLWRAGRLAPWHNAGILCHRTRRHCCDTPGSAAAIHREEARSIVFFGQSMRATDKRNTQLTLNGTPLRSAGAAPKEDMEGDVAGGGGGKKNRVQHPQSLIPTIICRKPGFLYVGREGWRRSAYDSILAGGCEAPHCEHGINEEDTTASLSLAMEWRGF